MAETVTYALSGSTESNGNVNFVATASGSITLSFGSDKTSSLAIARESLLIQANAITGGTDLYTGILNDRIADLAGKTLVPYITISVGDVNGDNSVSLADVTALVNQLREN